MNEGVDVIYQFLDEATAGVTQAIKEKAPGEVFHIGTNKDQYELYPEGTLTSIVQRIDELILRAAKMIEDGSWKGDYYNWGFEEGIVYLAPYHGTEDIVPQALKDKVTQTQEDIISGKIEVPRLSERTE
jgi:basic membrane protein A